MNMLASLKVADDVKVADEKDSVGFGAHVFESGLVTFDVGMAYTKKSDGGALGLFLTLTDPDGKELRQTLWMTSGDAKGNKPYYTNKDGDNLPLPGFSQANSLALLTTGKEISALDTEEKVIKLYNSEAKAEVPTKVMAVMDMIGQKVIAGVIKQTVDKTKKGDDGKYYATGETRDENEIDKFFCAKDSHLNMTTTEIKSKAEKADFFQVWSDKHTGKTKNKSTGVAATGTAGAPGAAAAGGTAKPGKSLFA